VGVELGPWEGCTDGDIDGYEDGDVDGVAVVGPLVGPVDGLGVGETEGETVGSGIVHISQNSGQMASFKYCAFSGPRGLLHVGSLWHSAGSREVQ
jgi:hypothetical protein